jgi:5'-nucleotidase
MTKVRFSAAGAAILLLSACASTRESGRGAAPVEVKIIAFNDFHGNLEPPRLSIEAPAAGDTKVRVPAGGAAYLASAVESLRAKNPNAVVVTAGDMIGATPFLSALFLDEPTIAALDFIRVDFSATGNHEFDKGRAELLRMQNGGCEQHGTRKPCQVDAAFPGARFKFLSANTIIESGESLFPGTGLRSFGKGRKAVKVGFIGMTLKETPTLVTPSGVAGLTFADEADTANALVPKLKAAGADAIVLLIHQGVSTEVGYNDKSCAGLAGDLLPVLDRLDPAIDVVVSGHTHNAYICDYGKVNAAKPFLLTSAGRYGTLVTDISLSIDPRSNRVTAKSADNIIIQGEAFRGSAGEVPLVADYPRFERNAEVAALIERYSAASAPIAARPVGRLTAPALKASGETRETPLGELIADSQLAATHAPGAGGAQIAFMNPYGVRADLIPAADGSVSYGQVFAVQPFANSLVVKSFTGKQLRALLEQQFESGSNSVERPNVLQPSANFRFSYDLSKPAGLRIVSVTVDGQPLRDDAVYRVAMNNFLASGGDNFTVFRDGTDAVVGMQDVDALEAYLSRGEPVTPPAADRIKDLTPK